MELFQGKESLKEKVDSDNNLKKRMAKNDFRVTSSFWDYH